MDRRGFLKLVGLGAAGLIVPELIVPERKIWQVPRNAPVGRRIVVGIDPAGGMSHSVAHQLIVHGDGTIEGTGNALNLYLDELERAQAEAIGRLSRDGEMRFEEAAALARREQAHIEALRTRFRLFGASGDLQSSPNDGLTWVHADGWMHATVT